ncbi:MAG: thiamine-phosphate kinase [Candidatus Nitrosothermus koennekii]|nr:MAG: thiamine-phosphate kinase [Candidatus Nitrosothermus koennekii]
MNEKDIIDIISKHIKLEHDDVSFIRLNDKFLVLKCDMLVRSTDAPKEMKLWQISRKSIVATLSDMVCKGVKPIASLISLAVPNTFTRKDINSLVRGFKVAEEEFGIKIIGGDTNAADDLIIDCIMAGFADNIIRRDNAKEGDIIISTGLFGYTSIGLKILLEDASANKRLRKKALESILMPKPRIEFLNIANYVNSSMDSSDGLAATLNELSSLSKKSFMIDNIPTTEEVYEFAESNNYDPEELIFDGGEEYEIIATLPKEHIDKVKSIMPIHIIGRVEKGSGVYIKSDSRFKRLRRKGFIHLANK